MFEILIATRGADHKTNMALFLQPSTIQTELWGLEAGGGVWAAHGNATTSRPPVLPRAPRPHVAPHSAGFGRPGRNARPSMTAFAMSITRDPLLPSDGAGGADCADSRPAGHPCFVNSNAGNRLEPAGADGRTERLVVAFVLVCVALGEIGDRLVERIGLSKVRRDRYRVP